MKVKIKRFDKNLPLPEYKSEGAACFDLYTREETKIESGEVRLIPLNIAVEIPKGYWVMMVARSSTHKLGVLQVNGIGIGDSDYCGDNDEYLFAALNFTKKTVIIEKGARIAQAMVCKAEPVELIEVKKMKAPNRGGFGSTGTK